MQCLLDLQRRIRAQAEQRGELMPIELNGRLGGGDIDTRRSDLLVRLPDGNPRLEPAARPQAVQLDQSPAIGKRAPRDGEGGEIRLRLKVGLRDGGREHKARLRSVGRDCAGFTERGLELGPMLAPEIELVVEVERNATLIHPAAAERRRVDVVLAQALAGRARIEVEPRIQGSACGVGQRACGAHARFGGAQTRVALERLLHKRVQLRLSEHRPPVLARPGAAARVLIEGERLRYERVRLALDARVARASGKQEADRQQERTELRPRHGRNLEARGFDRVALLVSAVTVRKSGGRPPAPDYRRWNKAKSNQSRMSSAGFPSWYRCPGCCSRSACT